MCPYKNRKFRLCDEGGRDWGYVVTNLGKSGVIKLEEVIDASLRDSGMGCGQTSCSQTCQQNHEEMHFCGCKPHGNLLQ